MYVAPFGLKELTEIAKLVKKYNKSIPEDMTIYGVENKLEIIAYEYLHSNTGYVSTYGVVFTFFNDHCGNRCVKFSLSPTLFSVDE
jgi:hypothetical protein